MTKLDCSASAFTEFTNPGNSVFLFNAASTGEWKAGVPGACGWWGREPGSLFCVLQTPLPNTTLTLPLLYPSGHPVHPPCRNWAYCSVSLPPHNPSVNTSSFGKNGSSFTRDLIAWQLLQVRSWTGKCFITHSIFLLLLLTLKFYWQILNEFFCILTLGSCREDSGVSIPFFLQQEAEKKRKIWDFLISFAFMEHVPKNIFQKRGSREMRGLKPPKWESDRNIWIGRTHGLCLTEESCLYPPIKCEKSDILFPRDAPAT